MMIHSTKLLSATGRQLLLSTLQGRLLAVCFGAGFDSTAMLVALRLVDIRPQVITFAADHRLPEGSACLDGVR